MRMTRKAQAGAAVLVVLIALLIILYVLFLPPTERAILLGENVPTTGGGGVANRSNVLFSTVPTVATQNAPQVRSLSSFTLRTVTSGNVLAERSGLVVERSAFHGGSETLSFTLPDTAKNVYLSFSVLEGVGDLQIALNQEPIFDSAITQRQPSPIVLSSSLLEKNNELTFSTSGVGFAIWTTNRYVLSDIRVTGDVTSFDQAGQLQRFVVRDVEDAENVELSFTADCRDQAGKLSLSLNSQIIYTGHPECGQDISMDLALSRLTEGENTLTWDVDDGEYTIDDVEVTTSWPSKSSTESFTISSEVYNRAITQATPILLQLSFRDQGAEGIVTVNGEDLAFRTHKQSFAAPITSYVRAGQNTISLKSSSADVTSLDVLLG